MANEAKGLFFFKLIAASVAVCLSTFFFSFKLSAFLWRGRGGGNWESFNRHKRTTLLHVSYVRQQIMRQELLDCEFAVVQLEKSTLLPFFLFFS